MRMKMLGVALGVGALALLTTPVLADATTAGAPAAQTSSSARNGTFVSASAIRDASGSVTITWKAATDKVTVSALTAPDQPSGQSLGQGPGSGRLVVDSLATDQTWYLLLRAGNGHSVVITTQTLGLSGAPNARDMGGYPTTGGGWVKVGLLFRAPALCGLGPDEVERLIQLDLQVDIDLRSDLEVDHCPAPDGLSAVFKRFGFIPEDDPMLTLNGAQTLDEYRAAFDEQGGPRGNNRAFQVSVALPHSVHVVRGVFDEILGANGNPVLVNCSAGQDRTGWVAYTMLRVLGVSPETALRDYMLSATYNGPDYLPAIEFFESLGYSAQESAQGVVVSPARIRTTLEAIELVYGSFDNYVRRGLGLSKADIAQLRSTYVAYG